MQRFLNFASPPTAPSVLTRAHSPITKRTHFAPHPLRIATPPPPHTCTTYPHPSHPPPPPPNAPPSPPPPPPPAPSLAPFILTFPTPSVPRQTTPFPLPPRRTKPPNLAHPSHFIPFARATSPRALFMIRSASPGNIIPTISANRTGANGHT